MFEVLRTKIGLQYARLRLSYHSDRAFRFTEALEHSQRALILFPETPIEPEATSSLIRYLLHRFSYERLTLFIREDLLFHLAPAPPVKTFLYTNDDISRYFIPRRRLQSKLLLNTFDVVIDLNLGLHLPSAYLCKTSNAPLRIGFVKPYSDHFYNLQIQAHGATSAVTTYRNFLKCLDMF